MAVQQNSPRGTNLRGFNEDQFRGAGNATCWLSPPSFGYLWDFKVDGHLTRRQFRGGAFEDPSFKRISAVISVEESARDGVGHSEIGHLCMVVHNPFALEPLEESVFARVPQLVKRDGYMFWTDRQGE